MDANTRSGSSRKNCSQRNHTQQASSTRKRAQRNHETAQKHANSRKTGKANQWQDARPVDTQPHQQGSTRLNTKAHRVGERVHGGQDPSAGVYGQLQQTIDGLAKRALHDRNGGERYVGATSKTLRAASQAYARLLIKTEASFSCTNARSSRQRT